MNLKIWDDLLFSLQNHKILQEVLKLNCLLLISILSILFFYWLINWNIEIDEFNGSFAQIWHFLFIETDICSFYYSVILNVYW